MQSFIFRLIAFFSRFKQTFRGNRSWRLQTNSVNEEVEKEREEEREREKEKKVARENPDR